MSWKHYMAFAPHSRNLQLIEKLIAYLAGIEYEFDVCLIILGKKIPALGLGSKKQPPILGRTVMLRSPLIPYEGNVVVKATNGARPH
jgi:predicted component of type VI protein secretion system